MTRNDGERIASLETEMKSVRQEVEKGFERITNDLKTLTESVNSLRKDGDNKYVMKSEYERSMAEIKSIATTRLWQATILTTVLTALFTFLVTNYFYR